MRITSKKFPRGLKVVGLILNRQKDKILLIERFNNGRHYYVFPGGGVENTDKTPEKALEREIKEETNVEINILGQFYELQILGHNRQLVYICEYISGDLMVTGEEKNKQNKTDKYIPTWFKVSQLSSINVFPEEIKNWLLDDLKRDRWSKKRLIADRKDF